MTKTVPYPPGFADRDDIHGTDPFYGHLGKGSIAEVFDGSRWTTVYGGLGGYGVVEGEHPQFSEFEDEDLPEPTGWLREPYKGIDGIPLGENVLLIKQGKRERDQS